MHSAEYIYETLFTKYMVSTKKKHSEKNTQEYSPEQKA